MIDNDYQTELDVFCTHCEKEFKDVMVWVGKEWNSWDCPECGKQQLDDNYGGETSSWANLI